MPSTNITNIQSALDSHMALLTTLNIAWHCVDFTPTDGEIVVEPRINALYRSKIAAGKKAAIQWNGFYQVKVKGAIGNGNGAVSSISDTIKDHFGNDLSLTASDGNIIVILPPTYISYFEDDKWLVGGIVVPFFINEIPS